MTTHRFEALDALRGVAAAVVLVHHLELRAGYNTSYFGHGYLAVDLFFMLSGFVIAYAYEARLLAGMSLEKFAAARLKRLYPIIFLATVLGLIAFFIRGGDFPQWPIAFFAQLLFIPWPGPSATGDLYNFNGAQWSLLFEIIANLVYAAVVRKLTNRVLLVIILISAAALIVTAYAYGNLGVGWGFGNAIGALPRTTFGFFVGVYGWRLWRDNQLPKVSVSWIVLMVIAATIFVAASIWPLVYHPLSDPLFVIAMFPPLLWATACSQVSGPAAKIGLLLGALSYPVYAVQGPVRSIVAQLAGAPAVHSPLLLAILVVAVVMASYAALKLYDEPIRTFLGKKRS